LKTFGAFRGGDEHLFDDGFVCGLSTRTNGGYGSRDGVKWKPA